MQSDALISAGKTATSASIRARTVRRLRWLGGVRGWGRIVNLLVGPEDADFTVENRGVFFTGNLRSHIDRHVYLFGGYEHAQIDQFIHLIPTDRRRVVLDVGGNVGNHSIAFAQAFDTVHGFEPNPILWDQYARNVAINNLDARVTLHRIGLGTQDTQQMLHMTQEANLGLGTFLTVEQYDLPLIPTSNCTIRNGDAYLAEQGITQVDAIKIDVQGFEPYVLQGLRGVITRDQPVIWFECSEATRSQINCRADIEQLVPYPFELFQLNRRGLTHVPVDAPLGDADYILVPSHLNPPRSA